MNNTPRLLDIQIDETTFRNSDSKRVVMCLPLTDITSVDSSGVCRTLQAKDARALFSTVERLLLSAENKEVLKSGSVKGYWDSDLFITERPKIKWTDYNFIVKDITISNKENKIGITIETLNTVAGRALADRLVYVDTGDIRLAIVVDTKCTLDNVQSIEDVICFRII